MKCSIFLDEGRMRESVQIIPFDNKCITALTIRPAIQGPEKEAYMKAEEEKEAAMKAAAQTEMDEEEEDHDEL